MERGPNTPAAPPPLATLILLPQQSLVRTVSSEQRWQDLASLLTIPPPPEQYQHYHQHPHNISGHGAAPGYTPNYHHAPIAPVPEKHPEAYGAAAPLEGAYKVESAHHPQQHDGIYYQNAAAEMAPTQDGFLQSILNDEDLQLMDMAMNEGEPFQLFALDRFSCRPPYLAESGQPRPSGASTLQSANVRPTKWLTTTSYATSVFINIYSVHRDSGVCLATGIIDSSRPARGHNALRFSRAN
ncbi:unnamed protein product, partial [Iphiclides podalirius]